MIFKCLRISFATVLLFITSLSYSQSGVVYSFYFRVDPLLTEYVKTDFQTTWFSEFTSSNEMPKALIDSIKMKTEQAFTRKLNMPVTMCFHENKSEVRFTTEGVHGVLEGLPEITTLKKGKENCPQNSKYIRIDVQLYSAGGTAITMVNTKTKLKPKLQITAKVVDDENNILWKNNVVLKDFAKLRSITRYYEGYDITTSEVLTPLDIYAMYIMGLESLFEE